MQSFQPVLFLDIDGVLNSNGFFKKIRNPQSALFIVEPGYKNLFDPDAIGHLNRICQATNCMVILTSSHRVTTSLPTINKMLNDHGFAYTVAGKTPDFVKKDGRLLERGGEIQAWLEEAQASSVLRLEPCILDDNGGLEPWAHRWIRTTFEAGLTADLANLAIYMMCAPLAFSRPAT